MTETLCPGLFYYYVSIINVTNEPMSDTYE